MEDCDCEAASQSTFHSPGPVGQGEEIVRLVFLPEQVNTDGTLKPTSISQADLELPVAGYQPPRGYSVNRSQYLDGDLIRRKAVDHQVRKPEDRREVWTYAANVDAIRQIRDLLGHQALCIVDRAEPGDPSHAECWGAKPDRKPSEIKKIRSDLAALLLRSQKIVG